MPRPAVRVLGNAASILTSDVFDRVSTFVLYLLVARHLGVVSFGRLSVALALFHPF